MSIRSWTACLAVATLAASAPSASAATITTSEPFAGAVPNDCTGEAFLAEGTVHMKSTDNSSLGGLKFQVETNLTGVKGTGLVTGMRYVMNQQSSEMTHADLDDAQMTIEQTIIMTRQAETATLLTAGDDFQLHVITHLTVTNNVAKATKFDLRADCR